MLRISLIGLIMVTITNLVLPYTVESEIQKKSESMVSTSLQKIGLKMATIEMQMKLLHLEAQSNTTLLDLIIEDMKSGVKEDKRNYKITNMMPRHYEGIDETNRKIYSNVVLIINNKDIYCRPESSIYGKTILEDIDYQHDNVFAFSSENQSDKTRLIGFVRTYTYKGMEIYSIVVREDRTVMSYIEEAKSGGLKDVAVIQGEKIMNATLSYEESKIRPDKFPTYMLENDDENIKKLESETGITYVTRSSFLPEGVRLVFYVSYQELYQPYKKIISIVTVILILFFLIYDMVIYASLKGSFKRLLRLTDKMKLAGRGDYSIQVENQGVDEVGIISEVFNKMIGEMNHNITQIVQYERNDKEMQYKLLVSQIDPHFIYNTLNTITYLSKMGKTEDVIIINRALISIIKDRLKMKGYDSFILLGEEINKIEDYMQIQKYLCHEKIALHFSVTEDCLEHIIPQNILQPLVENAIFHGLLHHKDDNGEVVPGNIEVVISKNENTMRIQVIDDGIGFEGDKIKEYSVETRSSLDISDHIGIKNIRMRLQYLYQGNYAYLISKREVGGTCIEIRFPIEPGIK